MAQYYTLPTAIGEAKIANAIALGGTITISELAIGDGGGTTPTPDSDRKSLVNQVRRAPINTSEVDPDNPNWIVVEQVLPPDIGGWTIREIGLFDADGDMIAYGNYPETYKPQLSEGSGRTQTIRFVMQVSDTAAVTLKVDPSVVLATRKYADDSIAAHASSRKHPAATTTGLGFVEKATIAESKSGATDKFPDSAGVKAALDARIADQATVDAGENDTKFVTAKKLHGAAGDIAQNVAIFDSPGVTEWTVPQVLRDGLRKAHVTVTGSGGGGAKNSSGSAGSGGGGATGIGLVTLTGMTTVTITVGSGGNGRAGGSGDGGTGGTSSFGPYVTSPGGGAGTHNGRSPGSGQSVGADISIGGSPGGGPGNSSPGSGEYTSGIPGGSYWGSGAAGGSTSLDSSDAVPYGAGGAGAGGGSSAGSKGADGIIIVRW